MEALLGERGTGIDQEYLVSWVPANGMLFAPSWEPAESVSMCAYAIEAYKKLFEKNSSSSSSGGIFLVPRTGRQNLVDIGDGELSQRLTPRNQNIMHSTG